MRIVFLGTGEFGCPALRALVAAGHEVVRAISQPDRPAGRGRHVAPSHIHALADELHIEHVQAEDVNALDAAELTAGAELGVVVAFGQKIGNPILEALPRGCINIHASLLPKYRGAAPFQWAILNGDATTGVTVFQLNERWDDGPILGMRETPIGELETATELHDRLSLVGAELIVNVVNAIQSGTVIPSKQDRSLASRAPKLSRADSAIDWSRTAFEIQRRIHGLWSWPAATCAFERPGREDERVQLARAAIEDQDAPPDASFAPGAFHPDGSVQTGRGRLRLLEIKPAGGKLMPFDAFARGREIAPPMRLKPLESD